MSLPFQGLALVLTEIQKTGKKIIKFISRRLLLPGKKSQFSRQGFLLPTVAVLLVVLSLVIASLLKQSQNRTNDFVADRQEQATYNAATPAIDRAKAKIQYLFTSDPRWPRRLPPDSFILSMLLNDGGETIQADADPLTAGNQNPYVLPDETQLDMDGDGVLDTAWSFKMDTNGDGDIENVAYGLFIKTNTVVGGVNITRAFPDKQKAPLLISRNGPVNMNFIGFGACDALTNDVFGDRGGWDIVNGATVRRAFQVTAVVIDDNQGVSRNITTLEMQQDRQAERGNKWGAWFRYDLEIFNGPIFNWNGAMHTEGNLMVGPANNRFRAYLISDPNSCLYARENSEITVAGNADESTPPFMGQIIRGSMKTNNNSGTTSEFDLFGLPDPQGNFSPTQFDLTDATDSTTSSNPSAQALDPVVLTTNTDPNIKNNNISRDWASDDTKNNKNVRDSGWKTRSAVAQGRVYNRSERAPYVDDSYRADNRYGPKPQYTQLISLAGKKSGDLISASDGNYAQLTDTNLLTPEKSGYDGYWERRAYIEGLRIIVGQRLELGNAYGWERDGSDPLNPAVQNYCTSGRCHEQRQWRTLRDNLAAVQTTVVYHNSRNAANDPSPDTFPRACLITTAHPGTATTITQSTTFNNIRLNGTNVINTDFFTGRGTNGWEFNPPAANETAFINALASASSPLRIALQNLANLAGDPFGAFPAKQDKTGDVAVTAAGQVTHPYPALSMWGDFSNLRRTLNLLNSVGYANLSIADQTNLHTAACTLGVLAYNIDNLQSFDYPLGGAPTATQTANTTAINTLYTTYLKDNMTVAKLGSNRTGRAESFISSTSVMPATSGNTAPVNRPQDFARSLHLREQMELDRRFGFRLYDADPADGGVGFKYTLNFHTGGFTYPVRNNSGNLQLVTFKKVAAAQSEVYTPSEATNPLVTPTVTPAITAGSQIGTIYLAFDPRRTNYFGFGAPTNADTEERFVKLALSLGPTGPKFPSLYYLFPKYEHGHTGADNFTDTSLSAPNVINHLQPTTEPYRDSTTNYINDTLINGNSAYKVVGDKNSNGVEDLAEMAPAVGDAGVRTIEIMPRPRNTWTLPNTGTVADRANIIVNNTGVPSTGNVAVSFLDKGIFNGREMMSVRVLDLDLNLMRNSTSGLTNENWLPFSGIIYAYREDAVREDAIARPAQPAGWTGCDDFAKIQTAACRMDAVSATPLDPPVNANNNISTKPVDMYADPDRRPHGFRLRNGADLRRVPDPPQDFFLKGMALVTDNTVYLMADKDNYFNLHADSSGNRIEEFTTLLDTQDWSNFYQRGNKNDPNSGLNLNFAGPSDRWRPAEIVADGISILSKNFVDGNIAQGITRQNNSSYRSLNAPSEAAQSWIREDGTSSNAVGNAVPIKISRNGYALYGAFNNPVEYGREATPKTFMVFSDGKSLATPPDDTWINAVIISGIIPSRAEQAYGGFHNFPRFLENWQNRRLNMSGAFIQLNFSTSATGPFDQDSWEPDQTAKSAELINYYGAPDRRWGYDVGLQYSPAGPISNRFVTAGNTRSEFYRKVPVDDPYVCLLRKTSVNGTPVDPNTSDCLP